MLFMLVYRVVCKKGKSDAEDQEIIIWQKNS